jgi:hypothetical protein
MLARRERLDHDTVQTLREMTNRGRQDCLGELISLFLDLFAGQLSVLFRHAERPAIWKASVPLVTIFASPGPASVRMF